MPLVRIKDTDEVVRFPDDMRAQEILAKLREYRPPNYSDALQKPPSMAIAYEPTLAEKMGQGISSALYDSGIISNRFAAQNIGRNATTGAEVLPIIGDALGADELGRAIKEGDAAGIGLGALSMIPAIGDFAPAIFAGVMARNADKVKLRKAQRMELLGADRDEIWKETGWFNDGGDWKWEISDNDAIGNLEIGKSDSLGLGDAMTHNSFYENYPEARFIPVTADPSRAGAGWNPVTKEMRIGTKFHEEANPLSSSLHESNHYVQDLENFYSGASNDSDSILKMKNKVSNEAWDASTKVFEAERALDDAKTTYGVGSMQYNNAQRKLNNAIKIKDAASEKERAIYGMSNNDIYERSAGEAEARIVQKRMSMTPEERLARPPWYDLDVPEEELIKFKDLLK